MNSSDTKIEERSGNHESGVSMSGIIKAMTTLWVFETKAMFLGYPRYRRGRKMTRASHWG